MKRNDFGALARSIDQAERIAWERIGGPTSSECAAIRRLEAALPAPATIEDWRWLAARLVRGMENGWHGGPVIMLSALAG